MPNTYKLYREYKYQFITKTGIKYSIELNDYKKLSGIPVPDSCELMFLSIERTKDKNAPKKKETDIMIRETIISILLNYFKKYDDIICYICSNANGKGEVRRKLFTKWFDLYNPGYFHQISHTFYNEEHIFIYDIRKQYAKHFLNSLNKLSL